MADLCRLRWSSRTSQPCITIVQVLLNCWCVWVMAQEVSGYGISKGMTFWGNQYDPTMKGFRVGFAIWVHYNNKFVELLDTAWMLLRKKDRQV
jgi:GNS1/SUR4 family